MHSMSPCGAPKLPKPLNRSCTKTAGRAMTQRQNGLKKQIIASVPTVLVYRSQQGLVKFCLSPVEGPDRCDRCGPVRRGAARCDAMLATEAWPLGPAECSAQQTAPSKLSPFGPRYPF